jgi:hypothetical protein
MEGGKKVGKEDRSEPLIEGASRQDREIDDHARIAGSEHAWVLIFCERATIETTVLEKGYVAAGGGLRGEKWLIPNHSWMHPQSFAPQSRGHVKTIAQGHIKKWS